MTRGTALIGLSGVYLCCLLLAGPQNALAVATVYTYDGTPFTDIRNFTPPAGTYDGTMRVTGSFTLADELDPFMGFAEVFPTSFSFSDGRNILSSAPPGVSNTEFFVSTGAGGAISTWVINISLTAADSVDGLARSIGTDNDTSSGIGIFDNGAIGAVSPFDQAFSLIPGTWSSAPVPEPGTMLLLGTSLAGLGLFRRLRNGRKKPVGS